jgi:hypothetical protein
LELQPGLFKPYLSARLTAGGDKPDKLAAVKFADYRQQKKTGTRITFRLWD